MIPDERIWRRNIYAQMLRAVHTIESDNFDVMRYPNVPPTSFFIESHADFFAYFGDHVTKFWVARCLLADEQSQELFDQLILYRMLGHLHVRLPLSNQESTAKLQVPDSWRVSETGDTGMFGPLSIFEVPIDNQTVWVKSWAVNVSAYLAGQYYFARDGVRIAPTFGDHVIDAGGCFGDTALFFAHHVGLTGRVYTFDPLSKHCQIMRDAFLLNSTLEPRIEIFEAGLADSDVAGTGNSGGNAIDPGARVGPESGLRLRTIDSVTAEGSIQRIDFIKMDIEGSELAALKGGERSIRKWKPRLAISLYHRAEDFFAIPLWLESLALGYRFYLDHYSIHNEETVLYAVAQ